LLTISKAKSRAASVGGRFQFKQPDDVAYWRKADSRCEQPKKRVTNGTMARSSARRSIKKKKARVHYAADLVLQLPARRSGSVALHPTLLDRFDW
jgi:hypothetical protein